MTRDSHAYCFIILHQDPKSAESTKEEDGVRSDDKSRIGRETRLIVAGLALADIAGLGELAEPGVTGMGVENDGMGIEVYSENSPGSRREDPYTSSAAQALMSGLNVDRMPTRTIGRLSTQCSRSACDMRAAFSCRCRHSAIPFAAG